MEKKLVWLYRLLGVVLVFSTISIINEVIALNVDDLLDRPIYKKALQGENSNWFTSEASLRYSAYFIKGLMIGLQIYLLYGFYLLYKTFVEFKDGTYFSNSISKNFGRVGNVFIRYCIYVFTLEVIYLFITLDGAPVLELIRKNHIDLLALCGIAFAVFSYVFKKGTKLKEENDLTV